LVYITRLYYNTRCKNIKSRLCLSLPSWTSLALLTKIKESGAHINKTNIALIALLWSLLGKKKFANIIPENYSKKKIIKFCNWSFHATLVL